MWLVCRTVDQPLTRRVLLHVKVECGSDGVEAHRQTEVSRPHHRAAPLAWVKKPGRQQLVGQSTTTGEIDDLHRAAVDRVAEDEEAEVGVFGIRVDAGFL